MLKMVNSTMAVVGLFASTSACGVRDVPLASGEGGAAGEQTADGGAVPQGGSASAGSGGASGAGTAGASGQPNCQEVERSWFNVCSRTSAADGASSARLTVVSSVAAERSGIGCLNYGSALDAATVPFVAWELEDADGNPWLVQFSITGATSDILTPGEVVDFSYVGDPGGVERAPQGRMAIERDGRPVIGFALSEQQFGLEVTPAETACPQEGQECGVQSSARITLGTESVVVPIGEVTEIGGLAVAVGYLRDTRDCEELPGGYVPDWLELGVYAPR